MKSKEEKYNIIRNKKKVKLKDTISELYYKHRYSYKSICETLNISMGTISNAISVDVHEKVQEKKRIRDIKNHAVAEFHYTEKNAIKLELKTHGLAEMSSQQPDNLYLKALSIKYRDLYSSFLMNQK